MDQTSLSLTPDEVRRLGRRVVDVFARRLETLPDRPVTRGGSRAALEALLGEPFPEGPTDPDAVFDRVVRDVMGRVGSVDHPRFFAFVPSPSNPIGVLADALAAGHNVFAGTWLEGAAAAQIELVTLDWLRESLGLPPSAGGLFTSGGSLANISGMAVARERMLGGTPDGGVAYLSDQAHSSVIRGLALLGIPRDRVRILPSDQAFRLDPGHLAFTVDSDRRAGLRPFCVIASAGTTNTGAVDPLAGLADLCSQERLWLHVDGAYGAAASICERGRLELEGIGRADSVSLDPHKWLFQPFEIGCLLVRDRRLLRDTFHILPEYMADTSGPEAEVNFCDYGPELTRGFRALKLWMSVQVFGLQAFREAVERGFDLAETAERMIRDLPGWEVVTSARMAVVTFRYAPRGMEPVAVDGLVRALVPRITDDGFSMITSTLLRGRPVLRLCTINPRTRDRDLQETLRRVDGMARSLAAGAGRAGVSPGAVESHLGVGGHHAPSDPPSDAK